MAALLTARVLAPHFNNIILFERDKFPATAGFRPGTAQAQHAHILLRRGLLGLEQLFPGYTLNLLDAGAILTNASRDWHTLFPMGAFPNFESDYEFICASRPLIEHTLRNTLLKQFSNVSIREQCNITHIQFSKNNSPTFTFQQNDGRSDNEFISADLVIDASGRNSHTPTWLQQQGYGTTRETCIKSWLGYSTRVYKDVAIPHGVSATVIMAKAPDITRGGILFPIENEQYMCTLYGFSKDYPPTDNTAYIEYAKSLRSNIIYNGIVDARPLTLPKAFVKNENTFRHYAEHKNWPLGFLVIGDAVCSLNPIYGQGITSTLIAVQRLEKFLSRGVSPKSTWAKKAQQKIVKSYQYPWIISMIEDLRWPKTEGLKAGIFSRSIHKFSNWIGVAATRNRDIAYTYIKVLHMTATPAAMFSVKNIARLLCDGIRHAQWKNRNPAISNGEKR